MRGGIVLASAMAMGVIFSLPANSQSSTIAAGQARMTGLAGGVATPAEKAPYIAELKTTKEIAELLCLSPHTVDTHRGNLMQKLNIHSIPEVILYAVRRGVVS